MYTTLQDFIKALEQTGELVRVRVPVSPMLEMSEISDRLARLPAPSVSADAMQFDPDHANFGGPAVLFENVEIPGKQPANTLGSHAQSQTGTHDTIPVAINLFGSYRRMEMALGCDPDGPTPGGYEGIAAQIASLLQPTPPRCLDDLAQLAAQYGPLLRIPPKQVRRGICQDIVKRGQDVNLLDLPVIKCWPCDGNPESVGWALPPDQPDTALGMGRFITLGGMYTIHADDANSKGIPKSLNIGMYRAQLIDPNHLAMHWQQHHDGAAHWRSWKRKAKVTGERMPMAIAIGGEGVLPYAATAPLPPGTSELLMAGFLNKGSIPLVRCQTVPIHVPANAEIVIEGYVSTEAGNPGYQSRDHKGNINPIGPGAILEGPFGDHTGHYSLPDRYPIMEVTAITTRRNPIYPTTVVGLPPQEDYYIAKATERLFLSMLKILIPDIIDYHLPFFGCFHNCAIVKIRKEYPFHARKVMNAIWGAGQMAWTKIIIVVDEDVNIHRLSDVLQAIFAHVDFGRDISLMTGPVDVLDHAAPQYAAGHKIGFDATKRLPEEILRIEPSAISNNNVSNGNTLIHIDDSSKLTPETIAALKEAIMRIKGVEQIGIPETGCGRCVFLKVARLPSANVRAIIKSVLELDLSNITHRSIDFMIAVDADAVNINNPEEVLFYFGANADPGRDMVCVSNRIGFDATSKGESDSPLNGYDVRPFPDTVAMTDEIRDRVTSRWSEYGFDQ